MSVQPPLFDVPLARSRTDRPGGRLDSASEALLSRYGAVRRGRGGHPRTVAREMSQLRSLARELGDNSPLSAVFHDAASLARLLLEPNAVVSASTGRCRLVAAQRFVRLCGHRVHVVDAEQFLARLDTLLPARSLRDWRSAGTIVAGHWSRRRPLGPTLAPRDLGNIITAVCARSHQRECRDRALVALHCYSGVRPEEATTLRWSQVRVDVHTRQVSIQLQRRGRWVYLILADPAAKLLLALREAEPEGVSPRAERHVFRRRERGQELLSSRAVRQIVQRACAHAGFPLATASVLRAAFAYWLGTQGLSDHEVAAVLGLQQVRSLDRLLAGHRALDAQRRVREALWSE
jgi:integrase